MHVGLRRLLKEATAIPAGKDVPIDCSPPCDQELSEENFPEVVLFATLGVRKCHGCKGQIIRKNCQPPQIWVFLHEGSSNMEIKSTNSVAKILQKHLFLLDNIICSVTQQKYNH